MSLSLVLLQEISNNTIKHTFAYPDKDVEVIQKPNTALPELNSNKI